MTAPTPGTGLPVEVLSDPGYGAELLAAALEYAGRGWFVVPLVPGTKRPAFPAHTADRCTPGAPGDPRCAAAGTHLGWADRASADPDRITRAWASPTAGGWFGVGIACGPSGLLAVDLDVPKPDPTPQRGRGRGRAGGGPVAAARAEAAARVAARLAELGLGPDAGGVAVLDAVRAAGAHPALPDTRTASTPSGGTHLVFTAPAPRAGAGWANTAGQIGPRVDTRATGGLIVAAPTLGVGPHGMARAYAWTDPRDPVPAPAWLADLCAHTDRPAPGPVRLRPRPDGAGDAGRARVAYLDAVLRRQCDRVAAAPAGERNRALYLSAVILGELAAGNPDQDWLPEAIERELLSVALAVGLPAREVAATLRSGARAGAKRPRPVVLDAA